MKNVKWIVGFVLIYALSSCSKPKPPQYAGFENFRIEKASVSKTILATDVKLYNPNDYTLQLKSADLEVYFNDKYLGRSTLDSLIKLASKDTTTFPLRMQASAKDILSSGAKLLLNPDVKIRITGNAKAGRGGVFINVPINYEGMQRINIQDLIGQYNKALKQSEVTP